MALPGNENPFVKILSEKPPTPGTQKTKKTFDKISLATGIKNDPGEPSLPSALKSDVAEPVTSSQTQMQATIPDASDYVVQSKNETREHQDSNEIASREQSSQQQTSIQNATILSKDNEKASNKQRDSNEIASREQSSQQQTSIQNANQIAYGIASRKHETLNKRTNKRPIKVVSSECDFYSVSGKERELVLFIYEEIINWNNAQTRQIYTSELEAALKVSAKRVSNLVTRVQQKSLIRVPSSLAARGGWRVFEMPTTIFMQAKEYLSLTVTSKQTGQHRDSNGIANQIADGIAQPSRKEGSINNYNYLTKDQDSLLQNEDFALAQMFDPKSINVEETRNSMHDFNYWPKYLSDIKRNLLAKKKWINADELQLLVDRLPEYIAFSKSAGQPVNHVGAFFIKEVMNYVSEKECTLSLFKTKAEQQKQDLIEKLKRKAIEEKKKLKEDTELIKNGAFAEWMESISEEDQKKLAHPLNSSAILIRTSLRAKFETEIWPLKKVELGLGDE